MFLDLSLFMKLQTAERNLQRKHSYVFTVQTEFTCNMIEMFCYLLMRTVVNMQPTSKSSSLMYGIYVYVCYHQGTEVI